MSSELTVDGKGVNVIVFKSRLIIIGMSSFVLQIGMFKMDYYYTK